MAKQTNEDELAFKAMKVLDDVFSSPAKAKDPEYRSVARMASSYLSTWATLKQADNNAEALRLMRARELANPDNGKEFKRYLLERS